MLPVPHRVVERTEEAAGVVTLTLASTAEVLAPAAPGQFVMLWMPAVGEIPISVSRVGDGGELLLTIRDVGAVSHAAVTAAPGDVVGARGPYGTAWPLASAAGRDTVVVGGGLGLAPLRIAIDGLVAGLGRPGGPSSVTVVVGSRQPDLLLYPDDLAAWTARGAAVHTTVDAADRSWHGAVGTATALLDRLGAAHELAFVCGPELMMTSAARALVRLGTPPEGVHVSLERNAHCGIGHCGRCQLGPYLLCRDGAVVAWPCVARLLEVRGR